MYINFRQVFVSFFLSLCVISLVGCWSNKDLTEKAYVVGVGLDLDEEQKYDLTVQIVKPSAATTVQGSNSNEEPVWVHTTRGNTIFKAVRAQLQTVNRKPNYSHSKIFVIGEDLARAGIKDILDFFERDPEPRLTASVVIAKGCSAKEILKLKSDVESIPALHLKGILESEDTHMFIQDVLFINLIQMLSSTGKNTVLGTIEIDKTNGEDNIKDAKVEGSAVFLKDKLIGWLSGYETGGYLYTQDKVTNGIIDVPNPLEENKLVAIEQVKSKVKMDVEISGDEFTLVVDVKATGNIGGQQGPGDLTTPPMLAALEKECAAYIKNQITHTIEKCQEEYEDDIFGFGEIVYRKNLDVWKEVEDDWNKIFSDSEVKVNVAFDMKRTGLIGKTITVR